MDLYIYLGLAFIVFSGAILSFGILCEINNPRCSVCGEIYRKEDVEGITRHGDELCLNCIQKMRKERSRARSEYVY